MTVWDKCPCATNVRVGQISVWDKCPRILCQGYAMLWVLGGRTETGQCFLVPCPGNNRGTDVLLPIIQLSNGGSSLGALSTLTSGELTTAFNRLDGY